MEAAAQALNCRCNNDEAKARERERESCYGLHKA